MTLAPYHVPDFSPEADEAAIVRGDRFRFTVLTPRIVRAEYDPDGEFEDRPSQVFWHREQPVPEFDVARGDGQLAIETEALRLEYTAEEPFAPSTLSAHVRESGSVWHYGDDDVANMGGTVRTLDRVEGSTDLEPGLLGGDGWTVLEDTDRLVFDDGWVTPRDAHDDYEDIYFFGYGHDYLGALEDFTAVSGDVPMIPRWALGNWWSRYTDYSADRHRSLIERFREEELPLSVWVLDMDWHVTDNEYHGGWTGWTWNRELFPDPEGFVDWLHDVGLKTTLNIHPADGVHPHEAAYPDIAEHVGIDPASGRPVEFDASDPQFLRGYFEHVIDPLEDDGVDFWWIDWQQWDESPEMAGLDPLWALNHLHALDRTRDGRRPFILSRWGGLGGHRYPVGFSGDAYISWGSLSFQPYLTATGSNVDFGWWSHDIGGHFGGSGTPTGFGELYARWLQFGVFSPINRIHTGNIEYIDKRPWTFEPTVRETLSEALRLRHALIPYLYTMARRNHDRGVPLVRPMYYHHPNAELAYHVPQQYYFGDELVVAPHVRERGDGTNLSRQTVWLPDGEWFDFETGRPARAGLDARYGDLGDVPVYARAGAIVPLDGEPGFGDVDSPETLRVVAFPGADNTVDLYEDDGTSQAYRDGEYATTTIRQSHEPGRVALTVEAASGATEHVPATRDLELCVRGVREDLAVEVDGADGSVAYDAETRAQTITIPDHDATSRVTVTLSAHDRGLVVPEDPRRDRVRELLRHLEIPARSKARIEEYAAAFIAGERADLDWLGDFRERLTGEQARAIVETLVDAGVAHVGNAEQERLLLWNGDGRTDVTYRLSTFERGSIPLAAEGETESGPLPSLKILELDDLGGEDWTLTVEYADAGRVTFDGTGEAQQYDGEIW
ncbi:Alpha-glucosidase, family 31 of glycosyl hydrolase [Halapricum desulfuricans]|uniref:Alpha-glucosidase, family 31 of glycosyl hydrolase n=1 Tax=Halapricum desulfuricans TaxID=2841257 RepID=A0A897NPP6_9EURY|nr:TIM-barrel domain-containing protein [Halapricum desulfuricans]QSG12809.1 Alpha-glucosidase, family 31 of glycosyl hydrolase [Halapricum desulfuricans]